MTTATVNVLLVEDNEIDREAVQRAFARHHIANPLRTAADGIEALEILRGSERERPLARPYLILLDINLPRMNGLELLRQLRADDKLHSSVVFVLTTSRSDEDKLASYRFNVAGYLVKSGAGFGGLVEMLDHYWRVNEFP